MLSKHFDYKKTLAEIIPKNFYYISEISEMISHYWDAFSEGCFLVFHQ